MLRLIFNVSHFSELNVASVDRKLCVTVAKNVAKTVKMFCVKSEQLVGQNAAVSSRKPVFGVRQKWGCTATEDCYRLEIYKKRDWSFYVAISCAEL